MGEGFWCDMCGLGLPTPQSLIPVKVGQDDVAKICINCSSNLKNTFAAKRNQIFQNKKMAQAAYEKQQQELAAAAAHQAESESAAELVQAEKEIFIQPIAKAPPEVPPQALRSAGQNAPAK